MDFINMLKSSLLGLFLTSGGNMTGTNLIKQLREKYEFLKSWPEYSNPTDAGYNQILKTTGEYDKNKHDAWINFLKWFYDKNDKYYQDSFGLKSSENGDSFKKAILDSYTTNKNIESFLSDKSKLEKLLKLYYFGENVGDIKNILDNQNHDSYKNACEFVNECLHIFRELKKDYCEGDITSNYKGGTVCSQLGEFLSRYEYSLYTPLKRHNKMSSLVNYPESAQVRCDLSYSLFFTPFLSLYKANSDEFTVFGNFVVSGFVMFAVYLILLILYKFTPIGLRFSPEGQRKARRIWRKVEMEHYRNPGNSLYSDDEQSMYSDNYGSANTFVYGNNRYY